MSRDDDICVCGHRRDEHFSAHNDSDCLKCECHRFAVVDTRRKSPEVK